MPSTIDKTESREWVSIDNNGTQILGVLHRPMTENPPVVLVLHGFASSKHGSNRCYVTLAEQLAQAGIATLRFDFRGSGDSEGSLDKASFEDLISDAVAMAEYVSSVDGVDEGRIGFFGASLGGAIAVQASAQSQAAKALALWAPVASGELWFRDFMMHHPELLAGDPNEAVGTYRGVNLSPLFREQFAQLFAYKTLAAMPELPLLHMHGEGDDVVTIAHQEAFKKCAGPISKFITYPEEQHSLGYAKAFPDAIGETVAFFKEHLA